MRILLTTDTIGGVWTFTKELATELLQAGHGVALVSFGRAPSFDQAAWCSSMRAAYGGIFRYDAFSIPLEWMPSNDTAYSEAEPLLLRVADEFAPDILHSNQFCFGRLPLPIPRIVTAHSDVLSWADACRPVGLDRSARGFDPDWIAQYRSLVQQGLDAADCVIAPTQWMLDAVSKNFALPCTRQVIFNGRSLPIAGVPEPRALQAVCAGRLWDEAKNIPILANVHAPFPILIAGDPQGMGAPSFASNVSLLGQLDEHDLLALFRRSSLYLATSIYEPFGLAPLEAALCGCAVIANDIPSLREVWGDAAVYFDNADALNRVLAHFHASPEWLHQAMRHSQQRALELTRSRMAEDYLALYNSLLSLQQQTSAYGPAAYA
jgi:glycogen(starch) synthase